MRDIQGEECNYMEQIREKFIKTAERFNFSLMEPTPLEMLSTLELKSGAGIGNETYSFTDKGGRKVGLRFDLTVGLARFVCQRRDLKMPTKLSSYGGVWRYDEPQAGRYRYFHQWDVEIFGSFSNEADSEIIQLVVTFLNSLGLNVIVEMNHRKVIETYVTEKLGIAEVPTISEMLRAVDKLSRKTPEQVVDEYRGRLDPLKLRELIDFSRFKGKPEQCPATNILDGIKGWNDMLEIFDSMKSRNINNVRLNFGIVRGLDYYSGFVFEVLEKDKSAALVGGGRYDMLPAAFGRKDIGATGAAGGVERILAAMENQKVLDINFKSPIYVAYSSEHVKNKAIQIVSFLRENGHIVDYGFEAKAIKRQINDGISRNASVIILVEEKDLRKDFVTIRNDRGEEKKIRITNIVEAIRAD